MINPINQAYTAYQQLQQPTTRKAAEPPPPPQQPQDTYTPSRASDLDHDGDQH